MKVALQPISYSVLTFVGIFLGAHGAIYLIGNVHFMYCINSTYIFFTNGSHLCSHLLWFILKITEFIESLWAYLLTTFLSFFTFYLSGRYINKNITTFYEREKNNNCVDKHTKSSYTKELDEQTN